MDDYWIKGIEENTDVAVRFGGGRDIPVSLQATSSPSRFLDIVATRSEGTAPAGISFKAVATDWGVENPAEDLRFEWDFGDPGSGFAALGDRVPKLWGRSANTAYLDRSAHTFAPSREDFADGLGGYLSEKTYAVRCTATDGSHTVRSAPFEVTIRNPDFVWPGGETYIVAPDGDFTDAPEDVAGAGYEEVTEIPEDIRGYRVLLKRGFEYEPGRELYFETSLRRSQFGAWGDGSKPVVKPPHPGGMFGVKYHKNRRGTEPEISVFGVHILAQWDPTTETIIGRPPKNGYPQTAAGFTFNGGCDDHVTLHDVSLYGVGVGILSSTKDIRLVMDSCHFSGWRNFGMLMSHQHVFAMIGCRIEQDPDALGGGAVPQPLRGTDNDQNIHGPIRIGNPSPDGWSVISMSELRSCNGWSGKSGDGVNSVLPATARPSHQSCLRFNTSCIPGAVLRMDRVVGEGGNAVFNATGFRDKKVVCDIVMDKIVGIGNANNAGSLFGTQFMGYTLRNFLAIIPAPEGGSELPSSSYAIAYGDETSTYPDEVLLAGAKIYSGSLLDWSSDTKTAVVNNLPGGKVGAGTVVSNIVHHAPNYDDPLDLSSDLVFERLFAPNYKGYKWENRHKDDGDTFYNFVDGVDTGRPNTLQGVEDSPTLDTRFATPDTFDQGGVTISSISAARPRSAGALPAVSGAGELVALDDIFGVLRGATPSSGAFEPS